MEHYFKCLILSLVFMLSESRNLVGSPQHVVDDFVIEPCDDDSDCTDWANATCVNFFCNCNGSSNCPKPLEELRTNQIGGNCKTDKGCNVEFSFCFKEKCICPDDRVATTDGRRCLRTAGLHSACEETIQCQAHAECKDKTCVCPKHMHEVDKECYNNAGLEELCSNNDECSMTPFSTCQSNKCTCQNNYVPSKTKSQCLPLATKINDTCQEDSQCSQSFLGAAECENGLCKCQALYMFDTRSKRQRCVRDRYLGNKCNEDSDCFEKNKTSEERLECKMEECSCKKPYEDIDGYCDEINKSSTQTLQLYPSLFLVLVLSLFLSR